MKAITAALALAAIGILCIGLAVFSATVHLSDDDQDPFFTLEDQI